MTRKTANWKADPKRFPEGQLIAADYDMAGFCLACGWRRENVEPDAKNYECHACERRAVYGASEIAIMGLVSEGTA